MKSHLLVIPIVIEEHVTVADEVVKHDLGIEITEGDYMAAL